MTIVTEIKTNQRTILYVDSDKELIKELQGYLAQHEIEKKFGLNFIFAENAKGALEKAKTEEIDLIVLEILLPVVNGYFLLNALKKIQKKPPVIIYTKLTGAGDLDKLASFEVANIFIKPLMPIEELIRKISDSKDIKNELETAMPKLKEQAKSLAETEVKSHLKIVQCPRCNMILPPTSHFCNNCGQKIEKGKDDKQAQKPSGGFKGAQTGKPSAVTSAGKPEDKLVGEPMSAPINAPLEAPADVENTQASKEKITEERPPENN